VTLDEGRRDNGVIARLNALEAEVSRLDELVDGQQSWSHRKRLHLLENDRRAVELAAQSLAAYRESRENKWTRVREWGAFLLAAVAIALSTHPWA
jgi:hypothetical protein